MYKILHFFITNQKLVAWKNAVLLTCLMLMPMLIVMVIVITFARKKQIMTVWQCWWLFFEDILGSTVFNPTAVHKVEMTKRSNYGPLLEKKWRMKIDHLHFSIISVVIIIFNVFLLLLLLLLSSCCPYYGLLVAIVIVFLLAPTGALYVMMY